MLAIQLPALHPCVRVFIAVLAKFAHLCYNKDREETHRKATTSSHGKLITRCNRFLCERGGYFLFMANINPVAMMSKLSMSYKVMVPTSFPFRDKKVKK